MNREVTLRLPEDVFHGASNLARISGFAMDELMARLFEAIVKPSRTADQNRKLIQRIFSFLPDEEIISLANLKMEQEKLDLFSQLLAAQKEQELSAGDTTDLESLGTLYDRINLVKSYAMVEAVRRKLIAVPEPA